MRLEVVHRTKYRYTASVWLEPHVMRFRPRSDSWQRLESYDLQIDPPPVACSEIRDVDGDESTIAWFLEPTDHLELTSTVVVETLRDNPFDFLWVGAETLPMQYPEGLVATLEPYRAHTSVPALLAFAEEVAASVGGAAQRTLPELAQRVYDTCAQIWRPDGAPWAPEVTLAERQGSCRDLAVLYVALCRELGFAGRFVSGYVASDKVARNELHAWCEVYVPGGGWRGYDPSNGLVVGDRYIAVAAAPEALQAAPVAGMFRGAATALPIETDVVVRRIE